MLKDIGGRLLDLLYPRTCLLCHRLIPESDQLFCCAACEAALPILEGTVCPTCSAQIGPHAFTAKRCRHCSGKPLYFQSTAAVGPYEDGLRDLILALKFRRVRGLGRELGQRLASEVSGKLWAGEIDVVMPVPLHWTRRVERGFNQAELIAEPIARRLGVPMNVSVLRKVRRTVAQARLTESQRRRNLENAFDVRTDDRMAGSTVLLVDDVMTTCVTCASASRELKRGGASGVYVAVVAR
jgi:ComF family protein